MRRLGRGSVTVFSTRYILLLVIMASVILALGGRLMHLQVAQKKFLKRQGEIRTVRRIDIPAYRGMITDRFGEPLAVSTPVVSVWINPKKFEPTFDNISELATALNVSTEFVTDKVYKYRHKDFAYLRRHVSPNIASHVKSLNLDGVYFKNEYRRFYPSGEVTAHVVGFTNIDDKGQEGLELGFNHWLEGTPGKRRIVRDGLGREVEFLEDIAKVENGRDLNLSIDLRLQYLAYNELKRAVLKHHARSGSAVVLDVNTSEVLAMVNQPSFNPNSRNRDMRSDKYRNRAVTDYFEPASAIKAFSIASVLEYNKNIDKNTLIDTAPGKMVVKGGIIRDDINYGIMSVSNVLKRSSNIGISKLVLDLPTDSLWDTYDRLGFGYSTNSGFPGETAGVLMPSGQDQPFVLATMAFGYGLTVTPLQLARAYTILGTGGVRRPVSFIKQTEIPDGVRVMSSKVAREVVDLLAGTVGHSRSKARVSGYHVAGKTGTARKLGKKGYVGDRHRAVFGGLAPAINPRFAIVVTINEPSNGEYYSNQVTAPVFSKIASEALRLFNVAPDLMDTQGVHVAQSGNNHS